MCVCVGWVCLCVCFTPAFLPPTFYPRLSSSKQIRTNIIRDQTFYQVKIIKLELYNHLLKLSDGSTGGEGGDHPVWRSQTGLDGVMMGWKILDFLVKFAAQEAYLLECS